MESKDPFESTGKFNPGSGFNTERSGQPSPSEEISLNERIQRRKDELLRESMVNNEAPPIALQNIKLDLTDVPSVIEYSKDNDSPCFKSKDGVSGNLFTRNSDENVSSPRGDPALCGPPPRKTLDVKQ